MLSALKPKHYVYIASLAATLSITAINRPLGLTTTGLTAGFGVARMTEKNESVIEDQLERSERLRESLEGEMSEEHDRVLRLTNDKTALRRELDKLKSQLAKVERNLIKARTEANQLRTGAGIKKLKAEHQATVAELSRQLAAISAQKADEIQRATTPLKEQIATLQKEIAAANGRNQRTNKQKIERVKELRQTIEALESQVEEQDARLVQQSRKHEQALAELEQKYAANRDALLGEVDLTFDDYEKKYASVCDRADAAVGELEQHREQLSARVLELQSELATPARFGGLGAADVMGNALIDFLTSHNYLMQAVLTDPNPVKGLLVQLKPVTPVAPAVIKTLMAECEIALSLKDKPVVSYGNNLFHFRLPVDRPFQKPEETAPKVPLSRLEKTLDSAIHARIVGGSGSGKTVLLNNLMHYMAASIEGANVTLLDPKAVDDWGHFTPKYWGEECVTGIVELANGLKWRVADTVKARKAGKPAPSYDPELFIVDEAQYNYLLAQNADDSYVGPAKEAPKYAKKAKGALAGLLSLGRAYNAIGLFVTQLPQVSKVGLNEGSFDPCVNIFLGVQIDNAIDTFLPGSGYSETKCKALSKELSIRRKLGQKWVMLVADLPRTEAYLMECPAPGYYQNKHRSFSGEIGQAAQLAGTAENLQSIDSTALQTGSKTASCEPSAGKRQALAGKTAGDKQPSAHCPKCSHLSSKYHGTKPKPNGKYRFICENSECEKGVKKGTFSALPLA